MSYNVLIVDDSSVIRSMVRKAIAMAGVPLGQVYEAGNGVEALAVLGEQWVDIVFSDLSMPEMGGHELIAKMGDDDRFDSIPVVIVSSEQNPNLAATDNRRVRAYLSKPFRPEQFRVVVEKVLAAGQEKP